MMFIGLICTFIGKVRTNFFAWTLRCGCISGFCIELLKVIVGFIRAKDTPCVVMAIVMNGIDLWRQALVCVYMLQIGYVLVRNSLPQPVEVNQTISTRMKLFTYLTLLVLPIICVAIFGFAHLISVYGFSRALFDWRERYQRCDFDTVMNFIVVIVPTLIMLLLQMVVFGMCLMTALIKVGLKISKILL